MRPRRRPDRAGRRRSSPVQLLDYWLNGRPDRRLGLSMLERFERLLLTQQTRLPRPQPRLLLIAWVPSRKNFLETPRAAATIALANFHPTRGPLKRNRSARANSATFLRGPARTMTCRLRGRCPPLRRRRGHVSRASEVFGRYWSCRR